MKVKVKRPCGNRYLVQLLESDFQKKAKQSGLILVDSTKERAKRDVCVARVIKRGISCKIEADKKTNWASVGDHVLINKYSWFEVPNEGDESCEMVVNDEDIIAIVEIEE